MMAKVFTRMRWQVLLLALVCGGIIHIAATFLVPQLATGGAIQKLAMDFPVNSMQVLPVASAERQLLPFISPDMRYAVCRFDVSNGPVAVSAVLPDLGWSLGLYSAVGDNFYAVPAQSGRRIDVNITLVQPPADGGGGFLGFGRPAPSNSSEIAVPRAQGLIIIRAPLKGEAYANEVEAQLGRAKCSAQRQ